MSGPGKKPKIQPHHKVKKSPRNQGKFIPWIEHVVIPKYRPAQAPWWAAKPAPLLRRLMESQGNRCCYCGLRWNQPWYHPHEQDAPSIEHFIPRFWGGKTNYDNCVAACRFCNTNYGSHTYIRRIKKKRRRIDFRYGKAPIELPQCLFHIGYPFRSQLDGERTVAPLLFVGRHGRDFDPKVEPEGPYGSLYYHPCRGLCPLSCSTNEGHLFKIAGTEDPCSREPR